MATAEVEIMLTSLETIVQWFSNCGAGPKALQVDVDGQVIYIAG